MVGLLYLPRLYVYHNDKDYLSDVDTTFLLMEHRLLKYIMKPALVATYAFGFILIYENDYLLSENYFLLMDGPKLQGEFFWGNNQQQNRKAPARQAPL